MLRVPVTTTRSHSPTTPAPATTTWAVKTLGLKTPAHGMTLVLVTQAVAATGTPERSARKGSALPGHPGGQPLEGHVRHHGQKADQHRALQHIGGVEAAQAHDDRGAQCFGAHG